MTNNCVAVTGWEIYDPEENINIDWPRLHKTLGQDHIDWLLEKSKDGQLTLHIEIPEDDSGPPVQRLTAEFHSEAAKLEYGLRFSVYER